MKFIVLMCERSTNFERSIIQKHCNIAYLHNNVLGCTWWNTIEHNWKPKYNYNCILDLNIRVEGQRLHATVAPKILFLSLLPNWTLNGFFISIYIFIYHKWLIINIITYHIEFANSPGGTFFVGHAIIILDSFTNKRFGFDHQRFD